MQQPRFSLGATVRRRATEELFGDTAPRVIVGIDQRSNGNFYRLHGSFGWIAERTLSLVEPTSRPDPKPAPDPVPPAGRVPRTIGFSLPILGEVN